MASILITGMNKAQCTHDFYLKQQLKVVPSHYSLVRCLAHMGHNVIQRTVKLGENLSQFDKVIVFLAGPRQLAATQFYTGLSAIANIPPEKLILAFDDWQTKGIYDGIAACKDPQKLFAQFILDVNDITMTDHVAFTSMFQDALDIILAKTIPVLLSCFAGGDPTLLIDYPRDKIFTYNPNPYHLNRTPSYPYSIPEEFNSAARLEEDRDIRPDEKIRMFNFVSLVQSKTKSWLKKQKISDEWPIEFFGSKKDGQRRLTEDEMIKVYAQQWGCLMPGYDHVGSGWWRARPLQVADAGSILIGDPKEMMIYYQDKQLANLKAGDLVSMTTSELETIAKCQKKLLYKNHPLDKEVQRAELKKVLDA